MKPLLPARASGGFIPIDGVCASEMPNGAWPKPLFSINTLGEPGVYQDHGILSIVKGDVAYPVDCLIPYMVQEAESDRGLCIHIYIPITHKIQVWWSGKGTYVLYSS
jgi:hypothetical protein